MKFNNSNKLTNKIIYQYCDAAIDIFASIDWYKLSKIISIHHPDVKDVEDKVYIALSNYHKLDNKKKQNYCFKIFKLKATNSYFNGSNKPNNYILSGMELKDKKAAVAFAYKISGAKEIYTGNSQEEFLSSGVLTYRANHECEENICNYLIDNHCEKLIDGILEQLSIYAWREDFDINQFVSYFISLMVNIHNVDQKKFYDLIFDYYMNIKVPYLYGFTRNEAQKRQIKPDKSIIDLINKVTGNC